MHRETVLNGSYLKPYAIRRREEVLKTNGHIDVIAEIEHEVLKLVRLVGYVTPSQQHRHQQKVKRREILEKFREGRKGGERH